MLVDRATGFALAQMPAIAYWLGETHGLLPAGLNGREHTPTCTARSQPTHASTCWA